MDIREWKGSTAKLYLALLFSPGYCGSQAALMGAMGTSDKATYLAARRQLEEVGIAYREEGMTYLRTEANPTYTYENHTSPTENPTSVAKNPTPEPENPTHEEETSDNPRTRCAQADRSGERTKQVEALHFSFGKRFPDKPQPNDESMRILLRLTGDSAEDVDEAFETAAVRPIESPWSYVRAMLARQKAAPKFAPAAIGPTSRSLDPDDLPPVDTETLAKMRAAGARMRQLGILPADGGDKWQ
jgi:hypothetical protein